MNHKEYIQEITLRVGKIAILKSRVRIEQENLQNFETEYIQSLKDKILKKFLNEAKPHWKYDPEHWQALMSLANLDTAQTEIHMSQGIIKYFNKRLNRSETL